MIEQLKVNPKFAKLKKEVGELNTLLSQQNIVFFRRLAIIHDLFEVGSSLVDQLSYLRTYFNDIEENIGTLCKFTFDLSDMKNFSLLCNNS